VKGALNPKSERGPGLPSLRQPFAFGSKHYKRANERGGGKKKHRQVLLGESTKKKIKRKIVAGVILRWAIEGGTGGLSGNKKKATCLEGEERKIKPRGESTDCRKDPRLLQKTTGGKKCESQSQVP